MKAMFGVFQLKETSSWNCAV